MIKDIEYYSEKNTILNSKKVISPTENQEKKATKNLNSYPEKFISSPENIPSLEAVKSKLMENGLEVIGDREPLSRGVFGPLFRIKVRDINTGEKKYIAERVFIKNRYEALSPLSKNTTTEQNEDCLIVQNKLGQLYINQKGELATDAIIIDHLNDEEDVLNNLKGLDGVPKTFGAVYQGETGSLLEEFIEGSDLQEAMLNKEIADPLEMAMIWEKIKEIYSAAAKLGCVGLDTTGTTIMIDAKTHQPYLADWYNCSRGSIVAEGPIKNQYLAGLKAIDDRISNLSIWYS